MLKTEKFLSNIDEDRFKVILNHAIPSDTISGVKVPDVVYWKFCDVMDVTDMNLIDAIESILRIFSDKKIDVMQTGASEFVSFAKHVQNEFKKVSLLMEQINSEPDPDLQAAGIDEMNKFGVLSIYYGISKNPLDWDAISEVAFHKIYSKLMMDKTSGEIQERYSKVVSEKMKRK